jgi:hypothetical protein
MPQEVENKQRPTSTRWEISGGPEAAVPRRNGEGECSLGVDLSAVLDRTTAAAKSAGTTATRVGTMGAGAAPVTAEAVTKADAEAELARWSEEYALEHGVPRSWRSRRS